MRGYEYVFMIARFSFRLSLSLSPDIVSSNIHSRRLTNSYLQIASERKVFGVSFRACDFSRLIKYDKY